MNIFRFAFIGDNQRVSEVLANEPNQINQILELNDENGVCKVTPIFLAAIAGKASTVNLLLEKKASIAPQESGEPLLNWIMASHEYAKVLRVVTNHCGDPKKIFQNSALNKDSKSSEALTELLKGNGFVARDAALSMDDCFWLGENASIDYIKEQFNEATPQVLLGLCLGALRRERIDVVTYLTEDMCLDIEVPILYGTFEGYNAVVIAAIKGDAKIFPLLKQMGIKLNDPVRFGIHRGQTPAYIAADKGHVAVLEFLHNNGYDVNTPIASGDHKGETPAYAAACSGQVAVLEFLQKNEYDLNKPLASGNAEGQTPVYAAASNGQLAVLEYLYRNGCPIDTPIATGRLTGLTPVFQAASSGHVAVIEYLHQNGCPIDTPIATGLYIGKTPASSAAMHAKAEVLNALQELGVDLDVPVRGIIPSKTPGVKKLTPNQRIEIAYRQLKRNPNWFRENTNRFIREMEAFPVADWIKERSYEDIREIYRLYREVGGKRTRWIADVVLHFANAQTPISQEEIRQLIALFDLTNYSLEDFVEATRPGPVLLTLLEALSQSKTVCENSDQNQLAQWISAVLLENGGDEEFWQKTQNYFQAIQKILKEKTTKTVRSGKGKGKGKGKGARSKDYLEPLWKKFESKIQRLNSSAEALTQSIDLKRVEVSKSFSGFFIEINGYIETMQEMIQVTAASDMDDSLDVEYIKAKTKKTEAVLQSLSEKRAGILADLEGIHKGFREMDFQRVKKVADLQQELNAVTTKIFLHCESHVKGFKEEIGELENRLFTDLSVLRQAHEFKRLQNTLLIVQMPNSHFSPYAGIERKALDNEASIWEERQTLLKGAKTTDELERIDREAKEKWEALGASLSVEIARQLQPSIPSKQTRDQRIDQHKDEKIQRLKREKKELTQEIERLQQMPIRSGSPEKKLPVVEKPVKERLIKRLKKIAFISDNASKALSMIEQEGKILSRVTEIEKFLALFKIEHQRTTGSHSTYSDGAQNVVIADHDGESKPYQVEDALNAVLDKLSGKKPS